MAATCGNALGVTVCTSYDMYLDLVCGRCVSAHVALLLSIQVAPTIGIESCLVHNYGIVEHDMVLKAQTRL